MFTSILAQMAGRGRKVPRAGWLVLNSKRAPRNFYKGKGVRSVGKHTKKGDVTQLNPKFTAEESNNGSCI